MTFFLDFDRTLFDNEKFFPYLAALPGLAGLRERIEKNIMTLRDGTLTGGPERLAMWAEVNAAYSRGDISFATGELAPFLFSDVEAFLQQHGAHSVVVTSGGNDATFQRAKIESCGVAGLVAETVLLVPGEVKGTIVAELMSRYAGPYTFVDDLVAQLDSVATATPEVRCFEMRRDGKTGSSTYPVVTSLHELEAAVVK